MHENLCFKIVKKSQRRIRLVRFRKVDKAAAPSMAGSTGAKKV